MSLIFPPIPSHFLTLDTILNRLISSHVRRSVWGSTDGFDWGSGTDDHQGCRLFGQMPLGNFDLLSSPLYRDPVYPEIQFYCECCSHWTSSRTCERWTTSTTTLMWQMLKQKRLLRLEDMVEFICDVICLSSCTVLIVKCLDQTNEVRCSSK